MAISTLFEKLFPKIFPEAVPVYPLGIDASAYLYGYVFFSILFYPFSCSIATIILYHRNKEIGSILGDKSLLSLVFTGMLIFNPIGILVTERLVLFTVLTISTPYQPGVQVVEILPGSPAADFGAIREGTIIFEIDGMKINDTLQALAVLNKTKPGELIGLRYRGDTPSTTWKPVET